MIESICSFSLFHVFSYIPEVLSAKEYCGTVPASNRGYHQAVVPFRPVFLGVNMLTVVGIRNGFLLTCILRRGYAIRSIGNVEDW